jgi:hypothetical protein
MRRALLIGAGVAAMVMSATASPAPAGASANVTAPEAAKAAAAAVAAQPGATPPVAPAVVDQASGSISDASGRVVVSMDPRRAATIRTADGTVLGIGLSNGPLTRPGRLEEGTVVFTDSSRPVATAVQILPSGSVRVLVVLSSAKAGGTFRFPLHLPSGYAAGLEADGSIDIADTNGTTVAGLAPAWARDANGARVASWYSLEGHTLVQHVALTGRTAFPVTADPAFFADCGIVTCTARLDRAQTRNARDAAWIASVGAGFCTFIPVPPAAAACAITVLAATVTFAVAAGRYYENGNCLGIRVSRVGGPVWPVEVGRGSFNCA